MPSKRVFRAISINQVFSPPFPVTSPIGLPFSPTYAFLADLGSWWASSSPCLSASSPPCNASFLSVAISITIGVGFRLRWNRRFAIESQLFERERNPYCTPTGSNPFESRVLRSRVLCPTGLFPSGESARPSIERARSPRLQPLPPPRKENRTKVLMQRGADPRVRRARNLLQPNQKIIWPVQPRAGPQVADFSPISPIARRWSGR
jgi:hypothetical protein